MDACITIKELADRVETAIEEHFIITPDGPNGYEWMAIKEGILDWEREGQPVADVIADIAQVPEAVVERVVAILQDRHYDHELAQMGESGPFDEDTYYDEKSPEDGEFFERWRAFERHLQSHTRFFSKFAEETLDDVFQGVTEHTQWDGKPAVEQVGPEQQITHLYRARVFQSDGPLAEALERPDLRLGPPPYKLATPGRLNAHGISMFYGTTLPDIALAEVRPPVGSKVLQGQFTILRTLRLLNLKTLQLIYTPGSFFDPNYSRDLGRAKFLKHISGLFSRPVMPDDQNFEYLITQVISDYLSSRVEAPLDGIMYESSQSNADGLNVALFHEASRVADIEFPEGTKISATLGHWGEDGWEEDYTVWEETPAPQSAEDAKAEPTQEEDWFEFAETEAETVALGDSREPAMAIDLNSVQVISVSGVTFEKFDAPVTRYRRQADEESPF